MRIRWTVALFELLPYYLGSVLDLSVCLNCVNKEQFNALCLLFFIGAVPFNRGFSVLYKRVNARVVCSFAASKTWHRLAVQSHKNRNPAGF